MSIDMRGIRWTENAETCVREAGALLQEYHAQGMRLSIHNITAPRISDARALVVREAETNSKPHSKHLGTWSWLGRVVVVQSGE